MAKARACDYCIYPSLDLTRLGIKVNSTGGTHLNAHSAPVTGTVIQHEFAGKASMAWAVYCFARRHAGISRHIYLNRADFFTPTAGVTESLVHVFRFSLNSDGEIACFPPDVLYTTVCHNTYQRMSRDLYHRTVSLPGYCHIANAAVRCRERPVQQCYKATTCGR